MTTVDLSSESERIVREQLEAGRYGAASEVVEDALRLLVERASDEDDLCGLDIEYVRAKVQEALDDPRPPVPAEEVFARLRAKLRRLEAADGE